MKLVLIILVFLSISALIIISNNSLSMYSLENRKTFIKEYSSWIGEIKSNLSTITGMISKMNWVPKT